MDIADKANDTMQMNLEVALTHRKQGDLQPMGRCYNCDELIENGAFCDPDCRDDYEKRERMKR